MQRTFHFLDYPLSIAPMMEWTDRHYRYLMRLLTKKTVLYTEMVTADSIINGNRERLLGREDDATIILQLGGRDPNKLAQAARIAHSFGYDSINLNVGCPSDRVKNGSFGACLMANPELVADCVLALRESSNLPISVKHRIGINGREEYKDMLNFVRIVHNRGGCNHFIVHARIAILGGISPSNNRNIPPLRYEDVFRLKKDMPHLSITINGGIRDLHSARNFIHQGIDGVMIGRAAYETPLIFTKADEFMIFNKDKDNALINQKIVHSETQDFLKEISPKITQYLKKVVDNGGKVNQVLRHTMGFLHGINGSRKYKQYLSDRMHREPYNVHLFQEAMDYALHPIAN